MVRSSPNVSSDSIFVKGWAPSVLNCVASGCGTGPAVLRRALNINEPMVLVALEDFAPLARPPADPPCQDWRHLRMPSRPSSPPALPASCEAARRASSRDDISIVEKGSLALGLLLSFHRFIMWVRMREGKTFVQARTLPWVTRASEPTSGYIAAPRRRSVGAGCGWVDGYLHQYVIAFGGVLWREHAADSAHARVVATTSIAIVVSVLGLVDGGAVMHTVQLAIALGGCQLGQALRSCSPAHSFAHLAGDPRQKPSVV